MFDLNVKMDQTKVLNQNTFVDYYNRLTNLALSIFEWQGLPDSVSVRYMETALFGSGRCLFFKDPMLGYLALRGGPDGPLNVYGDPITVRANGFNGYNKQLQPGEYVMIRNNLQTIPTETTIRLFAQRLTQAERSIDVNVSAQRTPVLILCEDKQRLTLKNVYQQYVGNEPVIFADKSLAPENFRVLKTDAPYVADKLQLYKTDLWNDCMTFLGINNANTDKRERLIVPEVEANDQLVTTSAQVMLLTRQDACKEINKLFGLNISVRMRSADELVDETAEEPDNKDQEVNGQ